jgi:hypothetical protein
MLKKARLWVVLALALTLAGTLLPSVARAHEGDFHATAVAEGGSTRFYYNPPGADPYQEFWLDAVVAIKHTVKADGKDYYRATFKINSLKGIFVDDDSIWAPPGDYQAADFNIRLVLYQRDPSTGTLTPLKANAWITSGNGYSYGCWGDGAEVQVNPGSSQVVARLYVRGERKFYYNGSWVSSGLGSGYHVTSSYRMDTIWWATEPPSMGHLYENDPLANVFVTTGSMPGGTFAGYCPLWAAAP